MAVLALLDYGAHLGIEDKTPDDVSSSWFKNLVNDWIQDKQPSTF
jgi:hypothetical protein